MRRATLVREVVDRLGNVQLVWFGTRGDDIEAATDIAQLGAAFSIISAQRRRASIHSVALEDISGVRVDLDTYDIDDHLHADATVALRRALLGILSRPSAVFTYRPSRFLSSVCFARRDRCTYVGMFHDHQAAFEHKPWVESEVARLGIAHIPWTYIADEDQVETIRFLRDGPLMLRRSRTTGGVGLVRIDDPTELRRLWPAEQEAYVSVAPFVEGGLPVNVGGVAWHDGVTVHPPSVQLIGTPGCTTRPFGYCGNDFGAVDQLDRAQLEQMDSAVVRIGGWLRRHGYLGAFGVDFLVKDEPLFTEVNPRFQGSTHASCQISVENGESCLLVEHLAALLGRDAPPTRHLTDHVALQPRLAHLVVHSTRDAQVSVDPLPLVDAVLSVPSSCRVDVQTRPALHTEPGATIARVTARDRLTASGYDLRDPWRSIVESTLRADEGTLFHSTDLASSVLPNVHIGAASGIPTLRSL